MKKLLLALLLMCPSLGLAQAGTSGGPTPGLATATCRMPFSFVATGSSGSFDNRVNGCTSWTMTYFADGCAAVSIQPQFAPDASGAAGAFSIIPAGSVFGAIPLTGTAQSQVTFSGYFPWMNVKLNTATSCTLVSGVLIGWQTQGASESSSAANPAQGTAAEGTTAVGFPEQVGGKFETTPTTLTNGQQGVLQQDANQNLLVKIGLPLSQDVTTTTATVVKATAGTIHTVTFNTGAAGTFKIFNLASASCTGTPSTNLFATITATTTTVQTLTYDANLSNGICVQASVAMDVTVVAQ